MRLHLGIFACLLCLSTPLLGSDAKAIRPGQILDVRMSGEDDHVVYRFRPSKGATAVHVVASAGLDVDLYVTAAELSVDTLGDAEHSGTTIDMLEWITVLPEDSEGFPGTEDLYLHLRHPGDTEIQVSVCVAEDVGDLPPVLTPGDRLAVILPSGTKVAKRRLILPGGIEFAGATAESASGMPQLRLVLGDRKVAGAARGTAALAFLGGVIPPDRGLWTVEIERPAGLPNKVRCTVAVEAFLAPRLLEGLEDGSVAAERLAGPEGELEFDLAEDDWEAFVVDVLPNTHGFRLDASVPEGDVDLFISRQRPVDTVDQNWCYASWIEGTSEILAATGTVPMPVGRYWVRAVHHDGDDVECTLSWTLFGDTSGEEPPVIGEEPVLANRPAKVEFSDNQVFRWFLLPAGMGPGAWVQVYLSDKNVELAVARSDSREILRIVETERNDEFLQIDPEFVLPEGVRLLVGVYRWSVREEVAAGSLHIGASRRPSPPPDYLPPHPDWRASGADLAMSASVEVTLEKSTGSGVVVSPTGLILTCHHVIEDGGEILISFPTGRRGRPRQAYEAEVLLADEGLDFALLGIVKDVFGNPVKRGDLKLPFVPFRRLRQMESLRPGDPLRLIGYGHSGSTRFGSNLLVFAGILSGFEEEAGQLRWIITDCRTGGGNSGGGYFNARYELVALHSMAVGKTGSALAYGRPASLLPSEWCDLILKEGGRLLLKEGER